MHRQRPYGSFFSFESESDDSIYILTIGRTAQITNGKLQFQYIFKVIYKVLSNGKKYMEKEGKVQKFVVLRQTYVFSVLL